jgi:hypothetical protein
MTESADQPSPAAEPAPADADPATAPVPDPQAPSTPPGAAWSGPPSVPARGGGGDGNSDGGRPVAEAAQERPEILVGAAFAGGLVLALILKRLGS